MPAKIRKKPHEKTGEVGKAQRDYLVRRAEAEIRDATSDHERYAAILKNIDWLPLWCEPERDRLIAQRERRLRRLKIGRDGEIGAISRRQAAELLFPLGGIAYQVERAS